MILREIFPPTRNAARVVFLFLSNKLDPEKHFEFGIMVLQLIVSTENGSTIRVPQLAAVELFEPIERHIHFERDKMIIPGFKPGSR